MFNDIHPSSTAGDGKKVFRRTTYKPGDRQIELIRCAQCGLPFRDGIDTQGDSSDSPGVTQALQTVTVSADNAKLPQPLKNMTAFQNGASVARIYDQTNSTGCRFCGSLNPRGVNRSTREWSGGPDMSNR